MMWKELHTSRTSGMAQVVGILVSLAIVGVIGYWTWLYGTMLFELQGSNYDSQGSNRQSFNGFLRFVSTAVGVISILASAVGGANALTSEARGRHLDQPGRHAARRTARSSGPRCWASCGSSGG